MDATFSIPDGRQELDDPPNGLTLAPPEDPEPPLIKPMKAVPGKHDPCPRPAAHRSQPERPEPSLDNPRKEDDH